MVRVLFVASLALLVSGCQSRGGGGGIHSTHSVAGTDDTTATHEVTELLRQYRRALAERDATAAGRIWADNLIFINHRGEILNKVERLENLRSGATAVRYIDVREETLRTFGDDTVITTGRVTIEGRYGGRESSGAYRSSIVWAKPGGRWQIVSVQTTRIEGAPTTATSGERSTPQ